MTPIKFLQHICVSSTILARLCSCRGSTRCSLTLRMKRAQFANDSGSRVKSLLNILKWLTHTDGFKRCYIWKGRQPPDLTAVMTINTTLFKLDLQIITWGFFSCCRWEIKWVAFKHEGITTDNRKNGHVSMTFPIGFWTIKVWWLRSF